MADAPAPGGIALALRMRIFGTALIAALLLAIEPRSSAPIDGETELGLTIGWQQGLAGSDAPGDVVFSG
ncbi:MAG: hypothetical protein OXN86_14415 [Chloroflexota bacterium]|nr:hypothetical protein [Chloroflexota bacterium]